VLLIVRNITPHIPLFVAVDVMSYTLFINMDDCGLYLELLKIIILKSLMG
jgi:hypothetical protein